MSCKSLIARNALTDATAEDQPSAVQQSPAALLGPPGYAPRVSSRGHAVDVSRVSLLTSVCWYVPLSHLDSFSPPRRHYR